MKIILQQKKVNYYINNMYNIHTYVHFLLVVKLCFVSFFNIMIIDVYNNVLSQACEGQTYTVDKVRAGVSVQSLYMH